MLLPVRDGELAGIPHWPARPWSVRCRPKERGKVASLMAPIAIAFVSFAFMLGGAFAGARLRRVLPRQHLDGNSKDIVRLGGDLLAALLAVALGLLVDSAFESFEAKRGELRRMATDIVLLDRLMEGFGQVGTPVRVLLRKGVAELAPRMWSADKPVSPDLGSGSIGSEIFLAIHHLPADHPAQQAARTHAGTLAIDIARHRLMLFESMESPMPIVIVSVLIFWLTALFLSFSLFTPVNRTGLAALVVISVAASLALLVFLELHDPFRGFLQIPSHAVSTLLPPIA
jgi:hypothetical protein